MTHERVGVTVGQTELGLEESHQFHVLLVAGVRQDRKPMLDWLPVGPFNRREIRRRAFYFRCT